MQTTAFSETRPFTIASRKMDTDGTPSGFELHVDASGQGRLEHGESFTRYMYERLVQAFVKQRQRRLRSVLEGQPVSGDGAMPMLLIHGPFPAPAVRPASGEVRFVLAFATGFGITNSLALFLNQLWLHTRRDLATQHYAREVDPAELQLTGYIGDQWTAEAVHQRDISREARDGHAVSRSAEVAHKGKVTSGM